MSNKYIDIYETNQNINGKSNYSPYTIQRYRYDHHLTWDKAVVIELSDYQKAAEQLYEIKGSTGNVFLAT